MSVGSIVAVIVGIILLVAAAIPITQNVIDSSNVTGTAATVLNLLPLMIAIGGIILVTRLY